MATFDPIFAADPDNPELIAADASILIFDPDDPGKAPVALTDPSGSPLPNPLTVNDKGWGPAFKTVNPVLFRVGWSGGGFEGFFTSYEGMRDTALEARDEAVAANAGLASAVASAQAAQTAAEAAANASVAGIVEDPADPGFYIPAATP